MTPRGTRPAHLRVVDDNMLEGSPVDEMIDSGGRDLLAENDPVAAETWASAMLDVFDRARWQARLDRMEVPPFEEALLRRCRQRRDRHAAVVTSALAAVMPLAEQPLALRVADELRRSVPGLPDWLGTVGCVTATEAWVASDVFGDQDSLMIGFSQQGVPGQHALAVLVDHNLSGQAKDAWVGADLDAVVASWQSTGDAHMVVVSVPADQALRRLNDAMATADLWDGDTELRSEDFARHRALVWARLRRAGLTGDRLQPTDVSEADRLALLEEFMASDEARPLLGHLRCEDVEILVSYLIDLRADYEGRPLRWSPNVVSLVLCDLAPRKLVLEPAQARALPAVLRGFVRFAGRQSGLEAGFVTEVVAKVDELERDFLALMADPRAAGPAKAVLAALRASGVDLGDVDAVNDALETMGPLTLARTPAKAKRPLSDAPESVASAAARSTVLERFAVLTGFYGAGRKLTQTGQPTLADARELVARLGTDDRLDEKIGDHTFRTRSAAELPELGYMLAWALEGGALRKQHGKLMATKSWEKLEDKPLARWVKAADALVELGPVGTFYKEGRFASTGTFVDRMAFDVLAWLQPGSMAFATVLDRICDRAGAGYEWLVPHMQDPEHRRACFEQDLALLARVFGWAGIAERAGATCEPDPFYGERLTGGALHLTPLGQWWFDGRWGREGLAPTL